ncbi:AIPR family protein [Ponticoccus alexandrii]|uniref:Abortive phage infection protein C-terminal domain-containing protein n=1 Tax=Ponticoccus alexandrii TaxID=1943633 RepID=A0ABX7F8P7_9RHOB|nr:AIPR family protein [Ponticoccus alexandrii]QRF66915.1 hypothetical protein GQA70_11690 [Ponticoccus alexandrii]
MNPVVQAQLTEFRKANPSIDLNESDFFEVFSIFSISNGLMAEDIDPFRSHLPGNEFGLDGVSILVQGELCMTSDEVSDALDVGRNHIVEFSLFQSKTSSRADYGDISKFFDAVVAFFEDDFPAATDDLQDRIDAMKAVYAAVLKKNPSLSLYYVTTGSGEVSSLLKKLIDASLQRLRDLNIFESVEFQLIGAKDLQDGYRSATNSNSASVEVQKPITLPDHPSVQQAFLGYISAEQLMSLVTTVGADESSRINKAVFFDNVRDFDEKSEINQGILRELENGGPQSFIFKNNGITVVAKNLTRQGDRFDLDDFQVVNGCQTSNILFKAGLSAQGVHVPFRLIVSNDSDFVSTVIVGTNRQNEVKEDQFWALTPFMKDLEEFCRAQEPEKVIFIERRENQYRSESVERTRIFKPSELIKAVSAMFLYQPHRAARDYRGVRKEFAAKLLQPEHSVKLYHAAAYSSYKIDFMIRNRRVDRSWGIYKYYVLYLLGQREAENDNILEGRTQRQDRVAERIVSVSESEDELLAVYNAVAERLGSAISAAQLDTREKIRDFIRSETVFRAFREGL